MSRVFIPITEGRAGRALLLRFAIMDPDLACRFDAEQNILFINQDVYPMLTPYQQSVLSKRKETTSTEYIQRF